MVETLLIAILIVLVAALGGVAYYSLRKPATLPTPKPTVAPTIISPTPQKIVETKEMQAKGGKEFQIVLDTNPTTGYEWKVDFDSEHIKLVKREYASTVSPKILGAGGYETFIFQAKKAGETKIAFSYLRLWEGKPAEKTILYNIQIE